jgi:8-oxo-dGTP pyrophosphatase MutT (NUDIX family)/phosphohistidine phosphatase SixA
VADAPPGSGELELLLIRSARWGDWTWPKGKIEPGETLPECAVREVREETGVQPVLGLPLPDVSYVMPDGQTKNVSYWAARTAATATATLRTAGDDEIAEAVWLPAKVGLERLTRPSDRIPAQALLALAEAGRLDTRALLILRHAKARSRAGWPGDEADRPLTALGMTQAQGLAPLLACWAPERLLSSPRARCMQTIHPYGRATQAEPEVLGLLSEHGHRQDPGRIAETLEAILADRRSALVCTHRPVLASIVNTLSDFATEAVREQLPHKDPWLAPAEILIAHLSDDVEPSVTERIRTVERYRSESAQSFTH